jgi:hypothetical protein
MLACERSLTGPCHHCEGWQARLSKDWSPVIAGLLRYRSYEFPLRAEAPVARVRCSIRGGVALSTVGGSPVSGTLSTLDGFFPERTHHAQRARRGTFRACCGTFEPGGDSEGERQAPQLATDQHRPAMYPRSSGLGGASTTGPLARVFPVHLSAGNSGSRSETRLSTWSLFLNTSANSVFHSHTMTATHTPSNARTARSTASNR